MLLVLERGERQARARLRHRRRRRGLRPSSPVRVRHVLSRRDAHGHSKCDGSGALDGGQEPIDPFDGSRCF